MVVYDQACEPGRRRAVIEGLWQEEFGPRVRSDATIDRLSYCPGLGVRTSVDFLQGLPQLKQVTVAVGDRCDVQALAQCDWLEVIGLVRRVGTFPDLSRLKLLRQLSVDHQPGAEAVLGLNSLESLAYGGYPFDDFQRVNGLRGLRSLTVAQSRIVALMGIDRFPRLERLRLVDCRRLREPRGLGTLPLLREVEFVCCAGLPSIDEIASLPEIEHILIDGSGVIPTLSPLLRCRRLRKVQLSKVQIGDGRIGVLEEVSTLTSALINPRGRCDVTPGRLRERIAARSGGRK